MQVIHECIFIIKISSNTDHMNKKVKVLLHRSPELSLFYLTRIIVWIYCSATWINACISTYYLKINYFKKHNLKIHKLRKRNETPFQHLPSTTIQLVFSKLPLTMCYVSFWMFFYISTYSHSYKIHSSKFFILTQLGSRYED